MNRLKVIIADDEELVRERLKSLVSSFSKFELVALCTNAGETIRTIESLQPDVLFLDIKMPGGDGFHVLDRTEHKNLLVIFVTAYDQFALRAFEYAAFDYLLKPITRTRFEKTVKRIFAHFDQHHSSNSEIINVIEKGVSHNINIAEITHLEAADNYVKIHIGKGFLKQRITLSKLLLKLEKRGIRRVHRSYAVNERQIREMARLPDGDFLIRLSNGRVVPTSRSYRSMAKRLHNDDEGRDI